MFAAHGQSSNCYLNKEHNLKEYAYCYLCFLKYIVLFFRFNSIKDSYPFKAIYGSGFLESKSSAPIIQLALFAFMMKYEYQSLHPED